MPSRRAGESGYCHCDECEQDRALRRKDRPPLRGEESKISDDEFWRRVDETTKVRRSTR